jgi:hypothetical protein
MKGLSLLNIRSPKSRLFTRTAPHSPILVFGENDPGLSTTDRMVSEPGTASHKEVVKLR